jgi:hypothetical protein
MIIIFALHRKDFLMDNNIYEKLFDITSKNMIASGNSFSHPKEAFLAYSDLEPHEVDVLRLSKINADNRTFLEIAYIAVLNRPIDEKALNSWEKRLSLPQDKFRELVIISLTTSQESNICHKRIKNNVFVEKKRKKSKNSSVNAIIEKLMPVYRRFPEKVKSPIRKIMGGNS